MHTSINYEFPSEILVFVLFSLLSLAMMIFWIWMLVDCVTKESSRGNDKIVWLLVLLLANWIGALIYFFVRRPQREDMKRRPPPHYPNKT